MLQGAHVSKIYRYYPSLMILIDAFFKHKTTL